MKAVVLETRGGYAAVLKEDGTVEKLKRKCLVGETIELEDEKKIVQLGKRSVRWAAAAAAAIVLLSAGGTYGFNNAYAYSYVTLDVNPSIEYVLNRRNQILSVQALNDSAEIIVNSLSTDGVRGEPFPAAIDETIDLLYEGDYLGEDRENCVLINVSSRGNAQENVLTEMVEDYFGNHDELSAYVTNASFEDTRQAKELGLSAGRYMLMEEILSQEGDMPAPRSTNDSLPFAQAAVGDLLTRGGHLPASDDRAEEPPARSPEGRASTEPGASPATETSAAGFDDIGAPHDGEYPPNGEPAPEAHDSSAYEFPASNNDASGEASR